MVADDAMGDRQSHAGPLRRSFGGEEGMEDAIEVGGIDAASLVFDEQMDKLARWQAGCYGYRRLRLDVDCTNSAALALYRQAGFERLAELPDYYGIGRPGWRLMCPLSVPAEESEPACLP